MNLIRLLPTLLVTAFAVIAATGQNLEPAPAAKPAPKPRDPSLVEVADVPGLPRVLLIGDSISMGYTLPVRKKLEGRANVHRPLENCGDTARGLARLGAWLTNGHWDVIHFNFGLHDLKYLDEKGNYVAPEKGKQVASPKVYRQRLRELTLRLKATGAKLIYATTTPVPSGTLGRNAGDEKVYNQVALEVMKEFDVPIDDLWGYVVENQRNQPGFSNDIPVLPQRAKARPGEIQEPFNVHFTPTGYEQLAGLVASSIEKSLPVK
jgi:acyl-CoA thioesterase-1